MLTPEEELQATVTKLAALNEKRASLIQYRDRQIREALDAGSTWVQVQKITGLSVRGVALAVKRT